MKKALPVLVSILLLTSFSIVHAQIRMSKPKAIPVKKPILNRNIVSSFGPDGAACDTVNLDAAANWDANIYLNPNGGYTFGVSDNVDHSDSSGFIIKEDANYFNVSTSDYNYISGGLVYFDSVNSNKKADLDKYVYFKVYDDNGGTPGNLLGIDSLTLSRIKQDVDNGYLTQFAFASPIQMPASKTFYISIDHSNFVWDNNSIRDSLAIVANGDDNATGAAYQFIDQIGLGDAWFAVNEIYGPLDVNLYIFPYVSNAIDGCTILPVSILNFGGFIKDNDAYLNWSTATESNNKGFYVERSKDAINFSDVDFVNGAGNSSQLKNYSYTDLTAKDMHVTTTYYRLKQVDLDGKVSYSKVLPLNLKNIVQWRLYPNPVKDVATVELNLTASSKVNVQVVAADGRIVMNSDKGILNQGTQQVFINIQNLAKGSYIVRVKTDSNTYTKTIVKE